MKREYVAVLLGGLLSAMAASGAAYIGTQKSLSENSVRIEKVEEDIKGINNIHRDVYKSLKELNQTNTKMQISLAKIATVIDYKIRETSNVRSINRSED